MYCCNESNNIIRSNYGAGINTNIVRYNALENSNMYKNKSLYANAVYAQPFHFS